MLLMTKFRSICKNNNTKFTAMYEGLRLYITQLANFDPAAAKICALASNLN